MDAKSFDLQCSNAGYGRTVTVVVRRASLAAASAGSRLPKPATAAALPMWRPASTRSVPPAG